MGLRIGTCFDRSFPPSAVVEFAERLETGGVDQLWVIEDCFYTAGISLAATALARTERLTVGLGILPAVARNPAVTAMELATLAELAPGRLLAGIGHGVQDWMEQMGARTPSPLTTLEEVLTVVRRLLAGERVTFEGRQVQLRDVELDRPPGTPPPVLAGVRGPRSLAMAGRVAEGLVIAEGAGPAYVRQALQQAGEPDPFRVSMFSALYIEDDRRDAYRRAAPFVAALCDAPPPNLTAHPRFEELHERWRARGAEGLADMPPEMWQELGAIGSFSDAVAHLEASHEAGVHDVGLLPVSELGQARAQIDDVIRIAAALR